MPSGAPLGNRNAAKRGLFHDAVIREIKFRDSKAGDGETLRKIAAKLLDDASLELAAAVQLRDTLDGKPAQSMILSGDDDRPPIAVVERKLIK